MAPTPYKTEGFVSAELLRQATDLVSAIDRRMYDLDRLHPDYPEQRDLLWEAFDLSSNLLLVLNGETPRDPVQRERRYNEYTREVLEDSSGVWRLSHTELVKFSKERLNKVTCTFVADGELPSLQDFAALASALLRLASIVEVLSPTPTEEA